MTALPTTDCRGCGKPIVFADVTKADGAPGKVPLDPKAPCYSATEMFGTVKAERAPGVFVTHFATCADANKFGRKSGGPSPQDEIDELREKLRVALDRIAVLEARPHTHGGSS